MLVPARALVWLTLVPLVLACVVPFDEAMLWPMIAADVGLVVLALLDAGMSRRRLVRASMQLPEVFSIARPNPVTVELRSLARRRLELELGCDLFAHAEAEGLPLRLSLEPGARAVARFRVTPTRRGAFEMGALVLRYNSPLGLWRRQLRCADHHPVRVYPDVQSVRSWELLARQDRQHSLMRTTRRLGGESEFEQLRDYSRDDEFRAIDWKATARRGKLTARQYQLESNQNLMFVLDAGRLMTAHTGGLSLFDHALNATLMLAHVAARGGDHVGMLSYADQVRAFVAPSNGRRAVQKLIQASYDLHPELVESDPERACSVLNLRVRKRTLVVLYTQVIDERAADELVRVTRGLLARHLPLLVLFRDVDVYGLLAGRGASELDLYTRGAAAELVAWREQLIHRCEAQGALVLDVAPRDLTATLINRYLEIKARHLL